MLYLLAVSLIWSFSFGWINLSFAEVDPIILACLRLAVALPCFLPVLRLGDLPFILSAKLLLLGAIQYGLMYAALFKSFAYLEGHEVAILTVLTPVYVVVFHSLWVRRLSLVYFLAAAGALTGGFLIEGTDSWTAPVRGIILVQISNAAFALGQVWYVQLRRAHMGNPGKELKDHQLFAIPLAGALIFCLLMSGFVGDWRQLGDLDSGQWLGILYLGAVATGLGFYWWNKGATMVNAGTLAVWNNLKIPLAVTVSLLLFGEATSIPRLATGGLLILLSLAVSRNNR